MSGQGYHLSLDEKQVNQLLSCSNEFEVLDYTSHIFERLWAEKDSLQIEGGYKDWNILLLCLNGGTYDPKDGIYPLNKCFFGGRLLVSEGSIINLVMPTEVEEIVKALDRINKKDFQAVYLRLPPNNYFKHMSSWSKDEEYSYELFTNLHKLRKFYRRVAQAGRAVVFYTDDPLDWFL